MLLQTLTRQLQRYESVLVAFSGGVDSAVVAVAARNVLGRDRTLAVLGVSAALAADQRAQARQIAEQFDLAFLEVDTAEVDDADYVANAPSRCYFCKRELWTRLTSVARERGLDALADGTNADDTGDHRPGYRAGVEFGVVTPLAAAGLGKSAVRAIARALGIRIWDAPAAPCLASRILYGIEVTPARLRQVEAAETVLRELGLTGDLRVRHRGDEARLEVPPDQFDLVRAHGPAIADRLARIGFARTTLDLAGYRRGSLLGKTNAAIEPVGANAG